MGDDSPDLLRLSKQSLESEFVDYDVSHTPFRRKAGYASGKQRKDTSCKGSCVESTQTWSIKIESLCLYS
jgi:hypothetical protein